MICNLIPDSYPLGTMSSSSCPATTAATLALAHEVKSVIQQINDCANNITNANFHSASDIALELDKINSRLASVCHSLGLKDLSDSIKVGDKFLHFGFYRPRTCIVNSIHGSTVYWKTNDNPELTRCGSSCISSFELREMRPFIGKEWTLKWD